VRGLWLVAGLILVALVVVGAKLVVRSAATGESVLPGVAGAPVIGPPPTATPTPQPVRGRVRVQVLDPAGAPVALALVELRDRFNAVQGSAETNVAGDVILTVPSGPGYTITARREGFGPGRSGPFAVDQPPPTPASGTPPRPPTQSLQVRLEPPAPTTAAVAVSRLFVGHGTSPRVTLIDPTASLLLKHSDPLGQGRQTVQAPSRDASRVYASWSGSTDLWVLNGSELTVERQVPLNGGAISALAVNPRDGRLWVATYNPETTDTGFLLEVDAGSFDVVRRVTLGQQTAGLRFQPDGSLLYARHRGGNAVSYVDPGTGRVERVARLPQFPTDMALSADGSRLYVVFLGSERLLELDARTGEQSRTVDIGSGAAAVLANPDGTRVYVVNQVLGSVQVVDLAGAQVTDLIPVGRSPQAAIVAGGGLYVANSGSGSVSVIDLEKHIIRETLQTGGSPSSLAIVERT
jgi:YVTN family beta-propeller protein